MKNDSPEILPNYTSYLAKLKEDDSNNDDLLVQRSKKPNLIRPEPAACSQSLDEVDLDDSKEA